MYRTLIFGLLTLLYQNGREFYQQALVQEQAAGNLEAAIQLYQDAARYAGDDRALAAQALLGAARCHEKLGQAKARELYEEIARTYYAVTDSRIIGGPSWVDSDRFNIEAVAENRSIGPGQMPIMLQGLLEDRFQLKVHRETKELPVYELVVARGGSKVKPSEDQTPTAAPLGPPSLPPRGEPGPGARGAIGGLRGGPPDLLNAPQQRGSFGRGNGQMRGTAIAVAPLVNALAQQLGRPVIDKTGLTGLFDFTLQWTPGAEQVPGPFAGDPAAAPPPPADSGPSIFSAIQEQLGLRLESTKGPVEVVVVDSAQKPSEN